MVKNFRGLFRTIINEIIDLYFHPNANPTKDTNQSTASLLPHYETDPVKKLV
jgi:hypothetical protein